jgi:hypothetical protein
MSPEGRSEASHGTTETHPDIQVESLPQGAEATPLKDKATLEETKDVLEKLRALIGLKPVTRRRLDDKRYEWQLQSKIRQVYERLVPPREEGKPTPPSAINAENLTQLVGDIEIDLTPGYEAVARLMIPFTQTPMFLGGGSYALFDMETGVLRHFSERRIGPDYEGDYNSAPYTATKPLMMAVAAHVGRTPVIENDASNEFMSGALDKPAGTIHMGGLAVKLLTGPDGKPEMFWMGISTATLTPAALRYMVETFEAQGATDSLDNDPQMGPHFTAAGYMDEIAGKVVEAALNGATQEECQEIADAEWIRLLRLAIPGPLKGQIH